MLSEEHRKLEQLILLSYKQPKPQRPAIDWTRFFQGLAGISGAVFLPAAGLFGAVGVITWRVTKD